MPDIADMHERATGVRVCKVLPCKEDHILLLDYNRASQSGVWANLRRVRSTGDVVWAISAPHSSDILVDVDWCEGRLVARTWGCFRVAVDEEAGRVIEVLFSK